MNPEIPHNPQGELEAKITALLLGELPPDEMAALQVAIEHDPELTKLQTRLRETIDLVRETATVSAAQPAPVPLRMSEKKRDALLQQFKTIRPKEFQKVLPRKTNWAVTAAVCGVIIMLFAALLLPSFSRAKSKSIRLAMVNDLRLLDGAKQQWALENRKGPDAVPTSSDLTPYLGRGPGILPERKDGIKYNYGKVSEAPSIEGSLEQIKKLQGQSRFSFFSRTESGDRVQVSLDDLINPLAENTPRQLANIPVATASPPPEVPSEISGRMQVSGQVNQTIVLPDSGSDTTLTVVPNGGVDNVVAPPPTKPRAGGELSLGYSTRGSGAVPNGTQVYTGPLIGGSGGGGGRGGSETAGNYAANLWGATNQLRAFYDDQTTQSSQWEKNGSGVKALADSLQNSTESSDAYKNPEVRFESGAFNPGTGNANPEPLAFNAGKQDGFNANSVSLSLEKPLEEGQWASGYKVELQHGPDTPGISGGVGGFINGPIRQAYVASKAPEAKVDLFAKSDTLTFSGSNTYGDAARKNVATVGGEKPPDHFFRLEEPTATTSPTASISAQGGTAPSYSVPVDVVAPGTYATASRYAVEAINGTNAADGRKIPIQYASPSDITNATAALASPPGTFPGAVPADGERGAVQKKEAPKSIATPQPTLGARFAEISQDDSRALGFDDTTASKVLTSPKASEDKSNLAKRDAKETPAQWGGKRHAAVTRITGAVASSFAGPRADDATVTELVTAMPVAPMASPAPTAPAPSEVPIYNRRKIVTQAGGKPFTPAQAEPSGIFPGAASTPSITSDGLKQLAQSTALQDGKLLYEMGSYDKAEAKLKEAAKADPANRGAANYFLSLTDKARSIKTGRDHAAAYKQESAKEGDAWFKSDKGEGRPAKEGKVRGTEFALNGEDINTINKGLPSEDITVHKREKEEFRAANNPALTAKAMPATPPASMDEITDLVAFDNTTLEEAVRTLARQAGINVIFDPKVLDSRDPTGNKIPLPNVSIRRFEHVNARQALNALLNDYNWQLVEDPKTRISRITAKSALEKPLVEDAPPPKSVLLAPIPQPEVLTRENAFSTFSLNVSDVSFKLAAASLEKSQMPEAASIRSEEFINAFDYRDPEPPAGVPVAFASERARYPFAHNRDLLRFSIKTAALGRQQNRPLNIVLLLDNSGSMERADRQSIIREALRVLATQLHPQDKLSVVTFARTARLWVDGVPGDQAGAVAEKVGGLTPQGGTNLEEAMNLAYKTALRHYLSNGINRVVLLTDGAANLGNVDANALQEKVETNRQQGVALDCFGIGWEGYNDDLLEVLSRHGDGRYAFINTPEEATTELAAKLAGALQVAAADVKAQIEFNPQRVTAYRQIGYAKHQLTKEQFRDNKVDAAEIGGAEAGNALYVIETKPDGIGPIATVRVRFKVPGTGDYQEHEWIVPCGGEALALEQASPAMKLAASASAFSEWLAGSPFAGEVTTDRLLGYLQGVPEFYGADGRPKKLEWMVRQAKTISGK